MKYVFFMYVFGQCVYDVLQFILLMFFINYQLNLDMVFQ